jgi:hypothetical protein
MRRGRWAGIAAAFAVVVATAVTAGCGGGSGNALSLDPVAAAATKTQQAGAARIRFALSFSSSQLQGGAKPVSILGAGAIDGASSELTFNVGSKSFKEISLEQNGDYVAYLQLGSLAANLPSGKQWVELDVSKLGKSAGLDLGSLLSGSQLQPGDLLSMLKAGGAKISNLGAATVDGAATTHYRVTIDLAKALQAKGLANPMLGAMVAQIPTVPADVWIGADGLVHRFRVSVGQGQSGAPLRLSMTVNISDYGARVTIAAPPSSDVFDATQLAQQGIGSSFH